MLAGRWVMSYIMFGRDGIVGRRDRRVLPVGAGLLTSWTSGRYLG
jgi:hypothetical protein